MDFFYKFIDLPLQFCYNGENTGKEAPRVTDRQIRCFLALYETLNFSAAARQLFLTQPTLSYQIRTLEEELGTPLFTRTTCRVEPTEAGKICGSSQLTFSQRGAQRQTGSISGTPCCVISDLSLAFLSKLCFLRNVPVKNT